MTTPDEQRAILEEYRTWQIDRMNAPADTSIDAFLTEIEANLNVRRIQDALTELQNERLEMDWDVIQERGDEIPDHLHALIERVFNALHSAESVLIDGREMIEDRTLTGDNVLRFSR